MGATGPAYDYDRHNPDYTAIRRPDPRIARLVTETLAGCRSVLNIGAGTGSYEPEGPFVLAVEPSASMRAKRLTLGRSPAINAKADALPLDDRSVDAVLGVLTIHHWPELEKGLRELRRVCRNRLVLLTYDPDQLDVFWNVHYFPELIEIERRRYPKLARIEEALGLEARVTHVPIPLDCTDGFQEAFYGRPEAFLNPEVRKAQSAWGFLAKDLEAVYVEHLARDLDSGEWDRQYGFYRSQGEFDGAFRMLQFSC